MWCVPDKQVKITLLVVVDGSKKIGLDATCFVRENHLSDGGGLIASSSVMTRSTGDNSMDNIIYHFK